jgi:hypothetical protein
MTRTIFITIALAFAAALPTAPAQAAQVARTFVSAAGSDGNNCANVLTPCRHLATAYLATTADGEIYVLDPANYGSLTITHGISIEGHGWASIAPAGAGSAAITINANTGDKINIIGVVLDGTTIANTTGINFNSGGSLTVRDSVIRNFGFDGIFFAPDSTPLNNILVSNTLISDNGHNAISIDSFGTGTTNGAVNHVEMGNNAGDGLSVLADGQTIHVTVSDSVSANNGSNGIFAQRTTGAVTIMVRNSTIANNGNAGLESTGTGATVRVTRSTIVGNNTGWVVGPTGVVSSYGDNDIFDNVGNNNAPPSVSHE